MEHNQILNLGEVKQPESKQQTVPSHFFEEWMMHPVITTVILTF